MASCCCSPCVRYWLKGRHSRHAHWHGRRPKYDGMPQDAGSTRSVKVLCSEECRDCVRQCLSPCCRPRMRGESTREWMFTLLEASTFGKFIDVMQIVLSLGLVALAISLAWDGPFHGQEEPWMGTMELVCTVLFTFDYLARWYAAEHRGAYIFTFYALIDAVTILPVYAQSIIEAAPSVGSIGDETEQYLRPIRVLRALRILRAFRLLSFSRSAVQRQGIMVAVTVVSVIVCTAGIVQAIEFDEDPDSQTGQILGFADAMYFIVVTVTTVGFGDISPKNGLSQAAVAIMILAAMVLIPTQVSKLSSLLSQRSVYDGTYRAIAGGRGHVLLAGDAPAYVVAHFLHEFFRNATQKVVILGSDEPDHDMNRLLMSPQFDRLVSFFRGSALLDSDLVRVKAATAHAAFVLLDIDNELPETMDTRANLITTSLRMHAASAGRRDLPLFTQVFSTADVRHAQLAGATEVLGSQHVKQALLAASVVIPGVTPFVSNLVSDFHANRDSISESPWLQEYCQGAENEIFLVPWPASMVGLSFYDAAEIAYVETGCIVLGIETVIDSGATNVEFDGTASDKRHAFRTMSRGGVDVAGEELGGLIHSDATPEPLNQPRQRQGRRGSVVTPMVSALSTVEDAVRRRLVLAPRRYSVHTSDRAVVIAMDRQAAEYVAMVPAHKVHSHQLVQNLYRGRGTGMMGYQGLAGAVKHKAGEGVGWSTLKSDIQRGALAKVAGFVATLPIERRVAIMRALLERSRDPEFVAQVKAHGSSRSSATLPPLPLSATDEATGAVITPPRRSSATSASAQCNIAASSINNSAGSVALGGGTGSSPPSPTASSEGRPAGRLPPLSAEDGTALLQPHRSPPPSRSSGAASAPVLASAVAAQPSASNQDILNEFGSLATLPRPGDSFASRTRAFAGTPSVAAASVAGSITGVAMGGEGSKRRRGMGSLEVLQSGRSVSFKPHSSPPHASPPHASLTGPSSSPLMMENAGRAEDQRTSTAGRVAAYRRFLTRPPPSNLAGHTVLVGLPYSLEDFIVPLRSHNPGNTRTKVVILSPTPPSLASATPILQVPNIYYVCGSARDYTALVTSGIETAGAVVILQHPTSPFPVQAGSHTIGSAAMPGFVPGTGGSASSGAGRAAAAAAVGNAGPQRRGDQLMVDADAMMTLRYLLEVTESVPEAPDIVVELVRGTNIRFVNYRRRDEDIDTFRLNNELFARSRYNDHTMHSGAQAVTGSAFHSVKEKSRKLAKKDSYGLRDFVMCPPFAAGRVCTSHMLECLVGAAYHKPFIIRVVELMLLGPYEPTHSSPHARGYDTRRSSVAGIMPSTTSTSVSSAPGSPKTPFADTPKPRVSRSFLRTIPVPEDAIDCDFVQLFVNLLRRHNLIALALLRRGNNSSPLPYVYTNPSPSAVVHARDQVMVFGPASPVEPPATPAPPRRRTSGGAGAGAGAGAEPIRRGCSRGRSPPPMHASVSPPRFAGGRSRRHSGGSISRVHPHS